MIASSAGEAVKTHAQSSADGNLEVEREAESVGQSGEAEIQPPDYETVMQQQRQEKEKREREMGQPNQKAVAFDVALSSDGQFMAKKPPPRRLEVCTDERRGSRRGTRCCLCDQGPLYALHVGHASQLYSRSCGSIDKQKCIDALSVSEYMEVMQSKLCVHFRGSQY